MNIDKFRTISSGSSSVYTSGVREMAADKALFRVRLECEQVRPVRPTSTLRLVPRDSLADELVTRAGT